MNKRNLNDFLIIFNNDFYFPFRSEWQWFIQFQKYSWLHLYVLLNRFFNNLCMMPVTNYFWRLYNCTLNKLYWIEQLTLLFRVLKESGIYWQLLKCLSWINKFYNLNRFIFGTFFSNISKASRQILVKDFICDFNENFTCLLTRIFSPVKFP